MYFTIGDANMVGLENVNVNANMETLNPKGKCKCKYRWSVWKM